MLLSLISPLRSLNSQPHHRIAYQKRRLFRNKAKKFCLDLPNWQLFCFGCEWKFRQSCVMWIFAIGSFIAPFSGSFFFFLLSSKLRLFYSIYDKASGWKLSFATSYWLFSIIHSSQWFNNGHILRVWWAEGCKLIKCLSFFHVQNIGTLYETT